MTRKIPIRPEKLNSLIYTTGALLLKVLLAGCAKENHTVIAVTGTTIGSKWVQVLCLQG